MNYAPTSMALIRQQLRLTPQVLKRSHTHRGLFEVGVGTKELIDVAQLVAISPIQAFPIGLAFMI